MTLPHIAEVAPVLRSINDDPPPIGTKVWIVTLYGSGYAGTYDKQDDTQVFWCPLPKMTPEQKRLLLARQAARLMRSE